MDSIDFVDVGVLKRDLVRLRRCLRQDLYRVYGRPRAFEPCYFVFACGFCGFVGVTEKRYELLLLSEDGDVTEVLDLGDVEARAWPLTFQVTCPRCGKIAEVVPFTYREQAMEYVKELNKIMIKIAMKWLERAK